MTSKMVRPGQQGWGSCHLRPRGQPGLCRRATLPVEKECVHGQLLGRVQLFMTPWTGLPGSSVHGIVRTRIPGWVAISSPRGSS